MNELKDLIGNTGIRVGQVALISYNGRSKDLTLSIITKIGKGGIHFKQFSNLASLYDQCIQTTSLRYYKKFIVIPESMLSKKNLEIFQATKKTLGIA